MISTSSVFDSGPTDRFLPSKLFRKGIDTTSHSVEDTKEFKIIDTPGLGDSSSLEQDIFNRWIDFTILVIFVSLWDANFTFLTIKYAKQSLHPYGILLLRSLNYCFQYEV